MMDQKFSTSNQRPSSSTLTRSRQVPLRPTVLFPSSTSPLKPPSKDPQPQDQSRKPHQPRQINSARVSQERTSSSPTKIPTSRAPITSSATQKNPLSARKGTINSTRSTSNGLGVAREIGKEKKIVITSPLQGKPLSSGDLVKGMGKFQLEANQSTSDLSQYGSCHSTKASRCPSGLLAPQSGLDDLVGGGNTTRRKNSTGITSPMKSPQLMSTRSKLESDMTNTSMDMKSPKVPGNTERQIKVMNVPSIDMKPVKKSKEEVYQSAPNSIDRYEFYADNFSLGKNTARTAQKPTNREAKIIVTIAEASQPETPQIGTGTSAYSILDQIIKAGLRPNSVLTVPAVTASPKLSPLGMILKRECVQTELEGDGEGDSSMQRDDKRANSAYLMPKKGSEKSLFGRKERHANSMTQIQKEEKSEQGSSMLNEKQRISSASRDRNVLMQPGSQSYGKFGNIYKGIENKDSWRFSIDRFKKLERQSAPRIVSERSQEPKSDKLNSFRERYAVRGERLSIGKESKRKEVDQSWSRVKESRVEESKVEESVNRTGEKEEMDTVGGAVGYLAGLKEKGLLELFKGKGDSRLYRELEMMKKEIEEMNECVNEAGEGDRREELEEKLLGLLSMTVSNLNMIIEKKGKV